MQSLNLTCPTGWGDLTNLQLRYLYTLIAANHTADEVKLLCLLRWSKTKVVARQPNGNYLLQQGSTLAEATPMQLAELLPHLDWLMQIPPYPVRITSLRLRRPLPADFEGVPFQTYIIADNLYQGYLQTQQDEILDQLANTLYGKATHLTAAERISIFYWMASLKQYFAKRYPDFLQPTNHASNLLFATAPNVEEAMNAQIRALTKGDITKEHTILQMDTWRALTELNAQAKEYHDLKSESKV